MAGSTYTGPGTAERQGTGGHSTGRHPASTDRQGGGDLRRGLEALTTFRRRVDALLQSYESSAAAPSEVAARTVPRPAFSGTALPFAEADGLHRQYHRAHDRLTTLTRTLGDQIEALGIVVHGADIGFDNVEDDVRSRFWEIQSRTDRGTGPAHEQR